jgi:tetratricopeptide (TPR) repeat protein
LAESGTARAAAGGNGTKGRRLIGWKAIGQFLGCTERTARRWEADRSLPVHRIPGGGRSSVWANAEELTGWLQALPSELQATLRAEARSDTVTADAAAPREPHTADAAADPPRSPADAAVPATDAPAANPPAADPPVTHVPLAPAEALPGAAAGALPPRRARRSWTLMLLAVLLAGAALLAWQLVPHTFHAAAAARGPYDDDPAARETYMSARFELATRSADGLSAARSKFNQLVERYPERAAGWSGLADTYLLLREFGSMPDEVAYPQAARAARTAVALDPQMASAWLDRAFIAWWWQGDSTTAFQAFATALRLAPNSAQAYHWYATARFAHGDYDEALQAIARARVLEPGNRAIVADEAWIRFGSGQRTESLATLERLVQLDPSFASSHFYLAHAYLIEQRDADFLREARMAAQLRGQAQTLDALRLAAERFQSDGRQAMLEQLSADEAQALARGSGSAVVVAEYRALAGDRDGMLTWLAQAEAQHDHNLPILRGFPEFLPYRDDPAFAAILSQLH